MAGQAATTAGDAVKGATAGAALGSVVPGIGTGIGAGVGALAGGLYGYFSSSGGGSQQITETPEQRAQRLKAEADVQTARAYRDRVLGANDAAPRAAPTVANPNQIYATRVGNAAQIAGPGNVTAGQVASSYDPSQANQARAQQQGYIDRLQGTINGTAPSAAVDAMRNASNRNVAGAYALAGSKGGYGGSSIREAQRQQGAAGQQLVGQVGQQRAAETAAAQQLQGAALENMRGQDLSGAQTGAQLGLQAGMANQGANLTAAQGNQTVGLDVQRANQAAKMTQIMAQAGFNQEAIMKMSDQELATRMANAGYKLSQEQIDDMRAQNQADNRQNAINAATGASAGGASRDQQMQMARAQYALAVQQNNQKAQDAAMAAISKLGAGYSTQPGGQPPAATPAWTPDQGAAGVGDYSSITDEDMFGTA